MGRTKSWTVSSAVNLVSEAETSAMGLQPSTTSLPITTVLGAEVVGAEDVGAKVSPGTVGPMVMGANDVGTAVGTWVVPVGCGVGRPVGAALVGDAVGPAVGFRVDGADVGEYV